ncbi:HRDC domain-containing protein [Deinococcus altitudinis]|uniref:HRDC domain-containing protein n=1 Tax=Deinococcus altitudinis TaxID=468914 RepID=UPI003891736A
MTASSTPLETLLAQAHAQPGEPQTRLSGLLSALEDADWTLLLASQEALAAQLVSLLGPGLIRLDPRLNVNREAFASFGLALASSDGDWKGARAVWLLEPDERSLARARRADVPLLADATLAPGGRWLEQGAHLVVYRDAVTLTGYDDVQMASVSGLGSRPRRAAAAPADLSVALALRDIGTLALRMNRRTRNTEALLARFEGRALPVSGGVLLLEHDGPQTVTPLGGNLSAARAVSAGTLVTVGIEAPDDSWAVLGAVLMGEAQPQATELEDFQDAEAEVAPVAVSPVRVQPEVAQARSSETQAPETQAPEVQAPEPQVPQGRSAQAARPGADVVQLEAARSAETQTEPEVVRAMELDAEKEETAAESAPTEDFSDREFVFSPPPVLPDLPSLPSVVSLPGLTGGNLADDPAQDDGRPAPKRNRGRRGKGQEAEAAAQPIVQPEIVMSESFSRPAEPVQPLSGTQPDSQISDDQMPDDQWPEEIQTASGGSEEAENADSDAADTDTGYTDTGYTDDGYADTLPLQLPPDLPTESKVAATDGLTDEQQAVYARLREWRNAEAKRQGLSSFIIASNATLAEVAKLVPYTEADLAAVRGMGPERLRKYGQKILEVVRG